MPTLRIEDRNLALEAVRVTERAAIASSVWMGRGDERSADQAAVDAMRQALNVLDIDGTVVIGEGERDEAPMLYIGERVGSGNGPRMDIALDPLEGTTITATGGPNAIACLAMAGEGGFLNAPDTYMDKIAVGGGLPDGVVHLEASPAENLRNLAQGQGRRGRRPGGADPRSSAPPGADRRGPRDRRPDPADPRRRRRGRDRDRAAEHRHRHLHGDRRRARGRARRRGAALDRRPDAGQAAPFATTTRRSRAKRMGITDLERIYDLHDLAAGDVMFAATGVTDGTMLAGVRRFAGGVITQSIVMRSKTGTVRVIETEHYIARKREVVPEFAA